VNHWIRCLLAAAAVGAAAAALQVARPLAVSQRNCRYCVALLLLLSLLLLHQLV
jgi:hypothetical protein